MRALIRSLTLAMLGVSAGPCYAVEPEEPAERCSVLTINDAVGDAAAHRTDTGSSGSVNPSCTLPDIVSITLKGWSPVSPAVDPYTGAVVPGKGADLFRLDLVFAGLVNPPGTLGLGSQPFNPFAFGNCPVFGFLELDVDHNRNTGGECGGAATLRYLANVARFGALPRGSIAQRVARSSADYDGNFGTGPQFERSGQDFSLVFCGCFGVTIVNTFGDQNSTFDAGDTWIVRGRFFQRAAGYEEASAAYGGSFLGLYDPQVNLRFSHSIDTNRTTLTLVYPLTMAGAGLLAGQPAEPIDLDVSNQTSVVEALDDVIAGACGPLYGCAYELTHLWAGESPSEYLDPTDWGVTALFGTAYLASGVALYVWTDVAGDQARGDFNADGLVTLADSMMLRNEILARDGGPTDADGLVNGSVGVGGFALNFSLFDQNYDGKIDAADQAMLPSVRPGDADSNCSVNFQDITSVLTNWASVYLPWPGTGPGDADRNGVVNFGDVTNVLSNWGGGCP